LFHRLTEFQAALLLAQMTRLEEQSKAREQNAKHLTRLLTEIPGILPAQMYPGCTRNAYHLYMFRYRQQDFANLPRAKFLKAMNAEGIPSSGGYTPLNQEPLITVALRMRGYQAIYHKACWPGGRSVTAVPKMIGCARRPYGSLRICFSASVMTWNR
jgi:perosamine synthetase